TLPAQQALLKLLEEPPLRTQMLLVAQSTKAVLPTILSRCRVQYAQPTSSHNLAHKPGVSLFAQLSECQSWRDVILVTQSLPTKKEECLELWRSELQRKL